MPRISVVIPSYNHSRFIGDAIRSVVAQRHDDLELVIIEDGSTDGSSARIREVLEACALPQCVFKEQKNAGAHDAIMRGVGESSGEIIAILNSDDRYAPERFERMTPYFEGRDEFIAFSKVRLIGSSGAALPDSHPAAAGYRHALYEATRCPTVGYALLRNNFSVTSGNFVFSRSLYDRLGGFTQHRLAHDWSFLLRALVHVEPIFVPEPLIDYRVHETNTIHEVSRFAESEGQDILNEYLALCDKGTGNPLAPCRQNWPLYFDLFCSRHAPWFGPKAIREWIDHTQALDTVNGEPADWRSWSEAVDFEPVDDCSYIVSAGANPAGLDALAVARDVLISEAHPLAYEFGDGPDTLRGVFERNAHLLPEVRCAPWRSPVSDQDDREPYDFEIAPDESARSSRKEAPSSSPRSRVLAGLRQVYRVLRPRSGSSAHAIIQRSGLFDADYYIVAGGLTGLKPSRALKHYLSTGAALGLDPHPLFDTGFYLETYPDVGRDGINPLLHYLAHGAVEGRNPHPLFGSRFYLESNPDVAASGMNPLAHYSQHGSFEGRDPHPRFDGEFYRENCPEQIRDDVSALAHYVLVGAGHGLSISRDAEALALINPTDRASVEGQARERGPAADSLRRLRFSGFFDSDYYSQQVYSRAEITDPFRHFIDVGSLEGLPFCRPETFAERLNLLGKRNLARAEFAYVGDAAAPIPEQAIVEVYVGSGGSPLYREMADLLAEGIERAGGVARVVDEDHAPADEATHRVIVAPHQFFLLGRGPERFDVEFLARSFLFMAEPVASRYFSIGIWFAQRARGVLDINPASALVWGEMGFRARFLPLGGTARNAAQAFDGRESVLRGALGSEPIGELPPIDAPLCDRPVDVFFDGTSSARRDRFFAKEAPFFASHRCALFLPVPDLNPSSELRSALTANEASAIARRSKIHLVLHQDRIPNFDWYRGVVRGMHQGALLVTEKALPVPGLISGKHYIECRASRIPATLEWLLTSPDGREEAESVRNQGMESIAAHYCPQKVSSRFLEDCRVGADAMPGADGERRTTV